MTTVPIGARSARRRRELASREFLLILLSCRELKSREISRLIGGDSYKLLRRGSLKLLTASYVFNNIGREMTIGETCDECAGCDENGGRGMTSKYRGKKRPAGSGKEK